MMQSDQSNGSTSIWCLINSLCKSSWESDALPVPNCPLTHRNCEGANVHCGNWSKLVFANWYCWDSPLAAPSPPSFAITAWAGCPNVWGGKAYPGDLQEMPAYWISTLSIVKRKHFKTSTPKCTHSCVRKDDLHFNSHPHTWDPSYQKIPTET